MTTLRERAFAGATESQKDAYARRMGFPNAGAFVVMAEMGARLQRGAKLTSADVQKVAAVYPNLAPEAIQVYANTINSAPTAEARTRALVGAVAGNSPDAMAQGLGAIQQFEVLATAGEVNNRSQSYVRRDQGGPNQTSAPINPNVAKHAHDADARRQLIAQLYRDPREAVLAAAPAQARREYLADKLDHLSNWDKDAPGSTVRDALTNAYDSHTAMALAEEEMEATDIIDVTEQEP